jgi:ABC-type Zn uptake system ZnuABC Zn-binding protein ZnuA
MKKLILLFIYFIFINFLYSKQLYVVATTEDLKSITEFIGKQKVKVESLSYGWQDPHSVDALPSMIVKLSKADMLVKIGLDLDMWVDGLILASRNKNITYGAVGYVDASVGITRLEVPTGKIDASMGDIHIYGNPHYWLDPENGKIIAKNILDGLCRLSPEDKAYFEKNYKEFVDELTKKIDYWKQRLKKYEGKNFVSYHKTFSYFAKRFNINIIATVEPKPGIPPSSAYLKTLVETIKKENVLCILHENFYPLKTSQSVAKQTNIKVMVLPTSVGGVKEVKDYFSLFDYIVTKIDETNENKNN